MSRRNGGLFGPRTRPVKREHQQAQGPSKKKCTEDASISLDQYLEPCSRIPTQDSKHLERITTQTKLEEINLQKLHDTIRGKFDRFWGVIGQTHDTSTIASASSNSTSTDKKKNTHTKRRVPVDTNSHDDWLDVSERLFQSLSQTMGGNDGRRMMVEFCQTRWKESSVESLEECTHEPELIRPSHIPQLMCESWTDKIPPCVYGEEHCCMKYLFKSSESGVQNCKPYVGMSWTSLEILALIKQGAHLDITPSRCYYCHLVDAYVWMHNVVACESKSNTAYDSSMNHHKQYVLPFHHVTSEPDGYRPDVCINLRGSPLHLKVRCANISDFEPVQVLIKYKENRYAGFTSKHVWTFKEKSHLLFQVSSRYSGGGSVDGFVGEEMINLSSSVLSTEYLLRCYFSNQDLQEKILQNIFPKSAPEKVFKYLKSDPLAGKGKPRRRMTFYDDRPPSDPPREISLDGRLCHDADVGVIYPEPPRRTAWETFKAGKLYHLFEGKIFSKVFHEDIHGSTMKHFADLCEVFGFYACDDEDEFSLECAVEFPRTYLYHPINGSAPTLQQIIDNRELLFASSVYLRMSVANVIASHLVGPEHTLQRYHHWREANIIEKLKNFFDAHRGYVEYFVTHSTWNIHQMHERTMHLPPHIMTSCPTNRNIRIEKPLWEWLRGSSDGKLYEDDLRFHRPVYVMKKNPSPREILHKMDSIFRAFGDDRQWAYKIILGNHGKFGESVRLFTALMFPTRDVIEGEFEDTFVRYVEQTIPDLPKTWKTIQCTMFSCAMYCVWVLENIRETHFPTEFNLTQDAAKFVYEAHYIHLHIQTFVPFIHATWKFSLFTNDELCMPRKIPSALDEYTSQVNRISLRTMFEPNDLRFDSEETSKDFTPCVSNVGFLHKQDNVENDWVRVMTKVLPCACQMRCLDELLLYLTTTHQQVHHYLKWCILNSLRGNYKHASFKPSLRVLLCIENTFANPALSQIRFDMFAFSLKFITLAVLREHFLSLCNMSCVSWLEVARTHFPRWNLFSKNAIFRCEYIREIYAEQCNLSEKESDPLQCLYFQDICEKVNNKNKRFIDEDDCKKREDITVTRTRQRRKAWNNAVGTICSPEAYFNRKPRGILARFAMDGNTSSVRRNTDSSFSHRMHTIIEVIHKECNIQLDEHFLRETRDNNAFHFVSETLKSDSKVTPAVRLLLSKRLEDIKSHKKLTDRERKIIVHFISQHERGAPVYLKSLMFIGVSVDGLVKLARLKHLHECSVIHDDPIYRCMASMDIRDMEILFYYFQRAHLHNTIRMYPLPISVKLKQEKSLRRKHALAFDEIIPPHKYTHRMCPVCRTPKNHLSENNSRGCFGPVNACYNEVYECYECFPDKGRRTTERNPTYQQSTTSGNNHTKIPKKHQLRTTSDAQHKRMVKIHQERQKNSYVFGVPYFEAKKRINVRCPEGLASGLPCLAFNVLGASVEYTGKYSFDGSDPDSYGICCSCGSFFRFPSSHYSWRDGIVCLRCRELHTCLTCECCNGIIRMENAYNAPKKSSSASQNTDHNDRGRNAKNRFERKVNKRMNINAPRYHLKAEEWHMNAVDRNKMDAEEKSKVTRTNKRLVVPSLRDISKMSQQELYARCELSTTGKYQQTATPREKSLREHYMEMLDRAGGIAPFYDSKMDSASVDITHCIFPSKEENFQEIKIPRSGLQVTLWDDSMGYGRHRTVFLCNNCYKSFTSVKVKTYRPSMYELRIMHEKSVHRSIDPLARFWNQPLLDSNSL